MPQRARKEHDENRKMHILVTPNKSCAVESFKLCFIIINTISNRFSVVGSWCRGWVVASSWFKIFYFFLLSNWYYWICSRLHALTLYLTTPSKKCGFCEFEKIFHEIQFHYFAILNWGTPDTRNSLLKLLKEYLLLTPFFE